MLADGGKRRKQNHHKGNSAGSQHGAWDKAHVYHSRYQGSNAHHQNQHGRTIPFLQQGPQQEDKGQVGKQVIPVGMTQDMGKKQEIIQRVCPVKCNPRTDFPRNHKKGRDETAQRWKVSYSQ